MLIILGLALVAAGLVLLVDLAGAGSAVIKHLTSKSLGSLAPGYAASRSGFRVYSVLIIAFGVMFLGLGAAAWQPWIGIGLMVIGLLAFIACSVLVWRGEVSTFRALPKK